MNDKLYEYADKFGESFPLFMMPVMTDEQIITIIDDCIASGKPYTPPGVSDDPEILY